MPNIRGFRCDKVEIFDWLEPGSKYSGYFMDVSLHVKTVVRFDSCQARPAKTVDARVILYLLATRPFECFCHVIDRRC